MEEYFIASELSILITELSYLVNTFSSNYEGIKFYMPLILGLINIIIVMTFTGLIAYHKKSNMKYAQHQYAIQMLLFWVPMIIYIPYILSILASIAYFVLIIVLAMMICGASNALGFAIGTKLDIYKYVDESLKKSEPLSYKSIEKIFDYIQIIHSLQQLIAAITNKKTETNKTTENINHHISTENQKFE